MAIIKDKYKVQTPLECYLAIVTVHYMVRTASKGYS